MKKCYLLCERKTKIFFMETLQKKTMNMFQTISFSKMINLFVIIYLTLKTMFHHSQKEYLYFYKIKNSFIESIGSMV